MFTLQLDILLFQLNIYTLSISCSKPNYYCINISMMCHVRHKSCVGCALLVGFRKELLLICFFEFYGP